MLLGQWRICVYNVLTNRIKTFEKYCGIDQIPTYVVVKLTEWWAPRLSKCVNNKGRYSCYHGDGYKVAFAISLDMVVSRCHWCTQRSIETVRYCSYREVGLLWYNLSVNHHQLWMNSPVQGRCTWTEQSQHYENSSTRWNQCFSSITKQITAVSKTDCWAKFTIFMWYCYVRGRAYSKVI